MKRLLILGIIVFVGLLFSTTAVIGDPAGPSGGLNVNIVNPLPVPVKGGVTLSRLPYQQRLTFSGSSADASYYHLLSAPAVPPDKRLVIEHISALINVDRPEAELGYLAFASPDAEMFVSGGDDIAIVQPSATKVTGAMKNILMIDRSIRAYYEPDTIPKVKVEVNKGLFDENVISEICIIGYLIDANN
jgi:hypothetical protein